MHSIDIQAGAVRKRKNRRDFIKIKPILHIYFKKIKSHFLFSFFHVEKLQLGLSWDLPMSIIFFGKLNIDSHLLEIFCPSPHESSLPWAGMSNPGSSIKELMSAFLCKN